jgi:uncharacterized repeat protein (TIGR03803 family)
LLTIAMLLLVPLVRPAATLAAGDQLVLQRLATFSFSDDGTQPTSLIQGADGCLFGTTSGTQNAALFTNGTVFKLTPGGELTVLVSFDLTSPVGGRPRALVQIPDGSFYGATYQPAPGHGRIFHLTPTGDLNVLFTFNGANGSSARTLIYGADGNLYGITDSGGSGGYGTVFKLTTKGDLTTLFSFSRTNGINPTSLVRDGDGTLFGTCSDWISVTAPDTVFKLTPSGAFTILASSFDSEISRPLSLVQGGDGSLYGVDQAGGAQRFGSVFKVTPAGTVTILAEFNGTNGWGPERLIQGVDGNLYGTTVAGGPDFAGWIPSDGGFVGSGSGTIFKLAPDGELTALASLQSMPGDDVVGFLQDANGIFYGGRTSGGPPEPAGIFRLAPPPILTALRRYGGQEAVTWTSFPGGEYRVEYKAALSAPAWQPLSSVVTAVTNTASVTNFPGESSGCYYRVRLLP